jgi:xylose dehydrogenase (NAD/NADP)
VSGAVGGASSVGGRGVSASSSVHAVRWGILGTGRVTRHFFAAIGDVAGASAAHDVPIAYGDYDALLADPQVDAVYLTLPNALHLPWSERALQAGKHVLCEKPLGADPAAVARAFETGRAAGRLLVEGFMYRHHPQTRRLVELVRDGAVGDVQLVRSSFSFPLADPANVRLSAALDGGALMDIGCYCVDMSRLLLGEPLDVRGDAVVGDSGVDVRFVGSMRFPGERIATFDAAITLPRTTELTVRGDAGTLRLSDPWHCRAPRIELQRDEGVEVLEPPASSPFRHQLARFAAAIAGEDDATPSPAESIAQAAALARLRAAAANARGG